MSKQSSKYFRWLLMSLTTLVFSGSSLLAQEKSTADRIYFKKGRYYHKKTGWVNSLGFYTLNLDKLPDGIGQRFAMQFEYLRYKLAKPRLGVGGGIALKISPTGRIGNYNVWSYYKFAEVFAYSKRYLNDRKRRWYIDARLGYAQALGEIQYNCVCSELMLNVRYTSGPTIQTGIGFEVAGSKAIRKGIKLSYFHNYINRQRDLFPEYWVTTSEGIIKRESKLSVIEGLVLGISMYL